jgi:hypothetical protein
MFGARCFPETTGIYRIATTLRPLAFEANNRPEDQRENDTDAELNAGTLRSKNGALDYSTRPESVRARGVETKLSRWRKDNSIARCWPYRTGKTKNTRPTAAMHIPLSTSP